MEKQIAGNNGERLQNSEANCGTIGGKSFGEFPFVIHIKIGIFQIARWFSQRQ